MTEGISAIKDQLAGIQLAIFEVVWPAFSWIDCIYVGGDGNQCVVWVQAGVKPDPDEWKAGVEALLEVFEIALEGMYGSISIRLVDTLRQDSSRLEVMSDHLFRQIAAEVAPWRLDAGR